MEKLTGDMVLVNPNLSVDPAKRQGDIGMITHADVKNDEFQVGFGNQSIGHYSSDALLVMKPAPELHRDILVKGKDLGKEDLKTVWRAHLFQEMGSMTDLTSALDLLRTNNVTLKFGTMSLQDKLAISVKQEQDMGRETSIGR